MKCKNAILIIFLTLLAFNSAAQKQHYNTCQMIKSELKSFIDTTKLQNGDKREHSVYVVTILEDKPNYIEFILHTFSDVHSLKNTSWNYCAMLHSEIVLIQNLGLQSISLVQCLDPQIISKENTVQVKRKLYDKNILIMGVEMYEICIIKDGELTKTIYPARG